MKTKTLIAAIIAINSMMIANGAIAQNSNKSRSSEPVKKKEADTSRSKNEENTIAVPTQAAQNSNIRSCRSLSEQVNRYLTTESINTAGIIFTAPENSNSRIMSSSIEIENKQGLTYASTTYSPNNDSGCGVAYDTVTYWNESCNDVYSKTLRELRSVGTLGTKIFILDGGTAMKMFLMPAGSGCVQIKKEVLY